MVCGVFFLKAIVMMKKFYGAILSLFVKRPTSTDIERILERESFIFDKEDVQDLLLGNTKGVRYGVKTLPRRESGEVVDRFVKIVIDGKWETYTLFKRQVFVSRALAAHAAKDDLFVSVAHASTSLPIAYAVFGTLPEGRGYGFMHDKKEYYDALSQDDVNNLVRKIFQFHSLGQDIVSLKDMRRIPHEKAFYCKENADLLAEKVVSKDVRGVLKECTVEDFFAKVYRVSNFLQESHKFLEDLFVEASQYVERGPVMTHADLAIDNIYMSESKDFSLIDFEWVGITHNPLIAIMYDYGNLRARAWSSPDFQTRLDKAFVSVGADVSEIPVDGIRVGMKLGLLRSTILMARYHIDYKHTTENDKRSDDEYFAMRDATVAQWHMLKVL